MLNALRWSQKCVEGPRPFVTLQIAKEVKAMPAMIAYKIHNTYQPGNLETF